jgi:Tfp pilus assembly protein PilF
MSSEPVRLELAEHDPEEYEGKYLDIHGVRYLVGPRLGHGEEKIVHALVNAESALSLHVLRVYRSPERPWLGLDLVHWVSRYSAATPGIAFADFMDVPYPGFRVELQERFPAAGELPADAPLGLINSVLATAPAHTGALMAKAGWFARRPGGEAAATSIALRAVEIEPNYLPYLVRAVTLAAGSGDYAAAVTTHNLIKQRYDYHCATDLAMIELHLRFGEPAAAAAVRASYPIEEAPAPPADLDARICAALAGRLESDRLAAQAHELLSGDQDRALSLVEAAVAACPESARMRANRGLLLALTGRPAEGAEELAAAAPALPPAGRIICMISEAYARLRAGDLDRAADAHATALAWLGGLVDVETLDGENFPRHARWIPLTGRPHPAGTVAGAAEIIAAALESAGPDAGEAAEYFGALLGFFRDHLAEQRKQFAEYEAGPGGQRLGGTLLSGARTK